MTAPAFDPAAWVDAAIAAGNQPTLTVAGGESGTRRGIWRTEPRNGCKGPPPVIDENFGAVAAELERRGLVAGVPAHEG